MLLISMVKPNVPVVYTENPGFVPNKNSSYVLPPKSDSALCGRPMRLTGRVAGWDMYASDCDRDEAKGVSAEVRAVITGGRGEGEVFWMSLDSLEMLS